MSAILRSSVEAGSQALTMLAQQIRAIETGGREGEKEGPFPVAARPWIGVFPGGLPARLDRRMDRTDVGRRGLLSGLGGCPRSYGEEKFLVVVDPEERFYPPAAQALGVAIERLIVLRPRQEADLIWSVDQALRCPAVGGVLASFTRLSELSARRFQLAAEQGGTLGCWLRPLSVQREPSWAEIQWLVEPLYDYRDQEADRTIRRIALRSLRMRFATEQRCRLRIETQKGTIAMETDHGSRVVCVWLPNWPCQRAKAIRRAELDQQPFVLQARDPRRGLRVMAADALARRHGIVPGMSISEAEGLANHVRILEYDAQEDLETLIELAEEAWQFSPLVGLEAMDETRWAGRALHQPQALLLDVTGIESFFGGPAGLIQQIETWLAAKGYRGVVAIGQSVGQAWAIAHYASDSSSKDFSLFDPLPIEALRLDIETVSLLHQLGIRTIGALASFAPARVSQSLWRETLATFGCCLSRPIRTDSIAERANFFHRLPQLGDRNVSSRNDRRIAASLDDTTVWPTSPARTRGFANRLRVAVGERSFTCRTSGVVSSHSRCGTPAPFSLGSRVAKVPSPRATQNVPNATKFSSRAARDQWMFARHPPSQSPAMETNRSFRCRRRSPSLQFGSLDRFAQRTIGTPTSRRASVVSTSSTRIGLPMAPPHRLPPRWSQAIDITQTSRASSVEPSCHDPWRRPLQLWHPPAPLEEVELPSNGAPTQFRFQSQTHRILRTWDPKESKAAGGKVPINVAITTVSKPIKEHGFGSTATCVLPNDGISMESSSGTIPPKPNPTSITIFARIKTPRYSEKPNKPLDKPAGFRRKSIVETSKPPTIRWVSQRASSDTPIHAIRYRHFVP